MNNKTQEKGSNIMKIAMIGAGITSVAAAAYFFLGSKGEEHKKHLKAWAIKMKGDIIEKIEEAKERMKKIEFDAFDVHLGELGVFSERFVSIIWIKLGGKGIFELQKKVDDALEGLFDKEKRFMSHVTIARPKKVFDKKILLDYLYKIKTKKECFNVKEFFLKSSDLREDGPVYLTIEEYAAEKA